MGNARRATPGVRRPDSHPDRQARWSDPPPVEPQHSTLAPPRLRRHSRAARPVHLASSDLLPTPYQSLDADGMIIDVNQAWLETMGYSRAEVIGRWFGSFLTPESVERFRTQFPITKATGSVHGVECETVRGDGGNFVASFYGVAAYDAQGRFQRTHVVLVDMTERRMSERTVRESEARYRGLFNCTSTCVAVYSACDEGRDFVIRDFNEAAGRLDKVTREQAVGKKVTEVFPGVRDFGLLDVMRRVWETGNSELHPLALYEDGRISGWRESSVYKLPTGEIVAAYQDVSERVRLQKSLSDQLHLQQILMDAIPSPVFYKNLQSRNLGHNQAFAAFFGRAASELVDRTTADLSLSELPAFHESVDAALIRDETTQVYEGLVQAADGSLRNAEIHRGVWRDHAGRVAGIVGTMVDVTERKRTEEALLASKQALEQSIHRLSTTMGSIVRAMVAAVEARDPYTAGHQRRVARLAVAIATELGLSRDVVEGLRYASMIHDIGKISVPAEILNKPMKLSAPEMELVQTHSQSGYDILKDIDFQWPVARIILQHHERLDGSGYPAGLKGDDILVEARVLAVADVVDAATCHRPYRAAQGLDAAIEDLTSQRGILYDAAVVDACVRVSRATGFALEDVL